MLTFIEDTGLPRLEEIVRAITRDALVFAHARSEADDAAARTAMLNITQGDRALLAWVHERLLADLDDGPGSELTQRALRNVRVALDPEDTIRRYDERSNDV